MNCIQLYRLATDFALTFRNVAGFLSWLSYWDTTNSRDTHQLWVSSNAQPTSRKLRILFAANLTLVGSSSAANFMGSQRTVSKWRTEKAFYKTKVKMHEKSLFTIFYLFECLVKYWSLWWCLLYYFVKRKETNIYRGPIRTSIWERKQHNKYIDPFLLHGFPFIENAINTHFMNFLLIKQYILKILVKARKTLHNPM